MPTYLLVGIDDNGVPTVTTLTDPVTVTEEIQVPLASLLPPPVEPPQPAA
jgi:hypothetical protein